MKNEIFVRMDDVEMNEEVMMEMLKGQKGIVQLRNDLKRLVDATNEELKNLNYELPELELYKHYNIGEYNIDVYVETVTCDGDIAVSVDMYAND